MNLVGNLLIAPPAVKGNFWYKTVIMITEHHTQGSVGLVINKRSELSLEEFGQQVGIDLPVAGYIYLGGPVNTKSLSLLHTNDWSSKNTLKINDVLSISSDETILHRIANGDHPEKWRMFLGLCGWSTGQLIGEIKGIPPWHKTNSWCYCQGNPELVFESDQKDQWCNALDQSGLEFAQNILL